MKKYTLVQDNGSCNDYKKIAVEICESDLVHELKRFFRWRKNVTVDRLYQQSSHNYDLFIKHLHGAGY